MERAVPDPAGVNDVGWATRWQRPGSREDQFVDPWGQSHWVRSGVGMVATNIAAVPFKFYVSPAPKAAEIPDTDPRLSAFRVPNLFLTSFEDLAYCTTVLIWLAGKCLWVCEGPNGARLKKGQIPFQFWPVPGGRFETVIEEKTGELLGYRVQGKPVPILYSPHEVILFKDPNPFNMIEGSARMGPVMISGQSDYNAQKWNRGFFERGAKPSGVLATEKPLTPTQLVQSRAMFDEEYAGVDKAHRVMILGGGTWTPDPGTIKDMEFAALRGFSRDELLGAAGSHKILHGFSEDINYATAAVCETIMMRYHAVPWGRRFSRIVTGALQRWGGLEGTAAAFDFSAVESLRPNQKEKWEIATLMQRSGVPLDVINRLLELNIDATELDGVSFLPSDLTPVTEETIDATVDQTVNPPPPPQVGAPGDAPNPGEDGEDAPAPEPNKSLGSGVEVERGSSRFLGSWRVLFSKLSNAFAKAMQRHLMVVRVQLLAALREAGRSLERASPSESIEQVIDKNRQAWDAAVQAIASRHYGQIAASVADWSGKQLEGGLQFFDVGNPALVEALSEKALKIVGINRTTEERVRKTIAEGMSNGETIADLQNRIKAAMSTTNARALTIARTETAQVSMMTRRELATTEGIKRWKWLTAGDENVRDSHVRANGEVRAIGEPFSNGLVAPGDVNGPPEEVINCRCIARYVRD